MSLFHVFCMASILSTSNVLTLSFPFMTKLYGIGSLDVLWRIDRFLRLEDEILVSPHRGKYPHVPYVIFFILLSCMGLVLSVVYSKVKMVRVDVVKI